MSWSWQSLSVWVNEALQHHADGSEGDHGFGNLRQFLIIFGQATPSAKPPERSFDYSPAGDHDEAGDAGDTVFPALGTILTSELEAGHQRSSCLIPVSARYQRPDTSGDPVTSLRRVAIELRAASRRTMNQARTTFAKIGAARACPRSLDPGQANLARLGSGLSVTAEVVLEDH